jgi:uncharacterized protein
MPPIFFDPVLMMVTAPAVLLAMWAQWRVHSSFTAASREPAPLTGAAAARHILDSAGATDVSIEPTHGTLSDHYDPRAKVLRLSEAVYGARSLAAVGIAAHEAGHALQDAQRYPLMSLRNAAVGVANFGSGLGVMMFILGLAMALKPVASNRAKAALVELGIVPPAEMPAVNKVLNAAAWTYVAATLQSVLTLLYYASYLTGNRSEDS